MSMSLDGFVATRDRDLTPLYPHLENLRNTEALAEMIEATGAEIKVIDSPGRTDIRYRVVK